ncbi:TetR/AcrR family transcriptional regulator [Streptantibioticus rubrisoli]|uniref:TetR/AcrR family transcriptional regulator n=1 Tax=Streptantibioticus rubrisoli TaxID=1387313 RepID=A0ABT1P629_9ACTN|nr:TetR/AcrR family transcriptional regulator [Streptantibioticus rubrisoli]MCQ4040826.1 TetR/AcrR family transcriptional regulator [Streptantibioticus rubrisoli]
MASAQRAERTGLTRDDLADAALRLLERDGPKGLSMRKVAAEVGVQAASLYWHVQNKEELLDLASDALWADIDIRTLTATPPAHWRDGVAEMARRLRTHLLARPNAVRVLAGRFSPGPRALAGMEALIDILRRAGFGGTDAVNAAYLVSTWVQGFVVHESVPMSAAEEPGATPGEALAEARRRLAALPAERYPNVRELAEEIAGPSMDSRFEFGLARLLDGLEPLR